MRIVNLGESLRIGTDDLCKLTGLTDQRHRQLAKEGFFPGPRVGKYQLWPAITGLLRYYREMSQRAKKNLAEDRGVKVRLENELLRQRLAASRRQLVPVRQVDHVWNGICTSLRQTLLAVDIPMVVKEELCAKVQAVNPDDYFAPDDTVEAGEEELEASEADSAAQGV